MTVILDVLPAAHGDALIITYGPPGDRHRILVDGGPAGPYADGLRAHLAALPPEDRHFELAIVTHIDTDHIDGALKLLRDEALGLQIDDVWFNGWPQVSSEPAEQDDGERGPLQGEFLSDLLGGRPWNTAVAGQPIRRDLAGKVPLAGGAELIVLSPTDKELGRLRREWTTTVTKAGFAPGDSAAVAKRLVEGRRYEPPRDPAELRERGEAGDRGGSKLGSDRAVANGSSIAVILQCEGKRVLLGGDAHAGVLTEALQGMADRFGTTTVGVDLFKLPHHGSAGNITRELIDLLRCDRFVVSTNGDHFNHPDVEAIELLGRPGAPTPPTVYFNYVSDTTRPWTDAAEQARVGIRALYGTDGHLSVEV